MRALRRSVLLVVVSGFAVCGVAATPAVGKVQCEGVAHCTTITGPWVDVPTQSVPNNFTATWSAMCPPGTTQAGSDWNAPPDPDDVTVFVEQGSGIRIYGTGRFALFLAVNNTREPRSFQPLLGCQANPARSFTALGQGEVTRVLTHRLEPSDRASSTLRCPVGTRLGSTGVGIGFFEKKPPSARELRELHVDRTEHPGRVAVQVKTGASVGHDERVELQVQVTCRR
jgi:hypothetical protein